MTQLGISKKNSIGIDSVAIIIILSLFMSQFYIWSSGLPQFSQIFIVLAFFIFAIKYKVINLSSTKFLFLFLTYVVLVNSIWFFVNDFDSSYIVSTIYWLFNFLTFTLLVNLKKESIKLFFEWLLKIIFFSYVLELVIWLVGSGRYDFAPRYNGFFNDPNQMAFWIISTASIYLCISEKKLKNLIVLILAVFLLLLTLSRSALIGVPFLALAFIAKQKGSVLNKTLFTIFSFVGISIISVYFYSRGFFDSIISRLILGIEEKGSQIEDRGFDALLDYPEHLFFGSGQGGYYLYTPVGNEIHSTWLGILFYYGSFGLFLFLAFLYKIFKKLTFAEKILFLGPMFYGFTTYNARTTIFWFFICIFLIKSKQQGKV